LRNKGFTLVEMLLVMVIIGFLSSILVMRASDYSGVAKTKAVKADLHTLKTAVEAYIINNGGVPGGGMLEEALTSETNRLVDEVPEDPFNPGNDYAYAPDDDGEARYAIGSTGPNKATGLYCTGDEVVDTDGDDIWVSNCKTNNHGG
jgi:general secretion pathway protein G